MRALVPLVLLVSACSLSVKGYTPCETHDACRGAFGLGTVCGEDGFCVEDPGHERCTASVPDGAWERLDELADALVLGAIYDHSADQPMRQATSLAVDQVRALPELDGREMVLLECDYGPLEAVDALEIPEAAANVADYLTDRLGVRAIVGPATSDASQAAYDAVAGTDTLFVSPSATSTALTEIDGLAPTDEAPGLFWRTVTADDVQGLVIARDLIFRGVATISIVYQQSSYGSGLADMVIAGFEDEAAGRTAHRHPYADANEMSTARDAAGEDSSTEVLFFSSEVPDTIAFFNGAALASGFETKTLFMADAAADASFLAGTADNASQYEKLRGSRPAIPSGMVFDRFRSDYSAAFEGEDAAQSVFTAYSFDATWLALYGMAWSVGEQGSVSGTPMARGLRHVSSGDPFTVVPESWNSIVSRFEVGSGVDLTGASGELDFDPATEELSGAMEVWHIVDDGEGGHEFEALLLCTPPDYECVAE